MIGTFKGKEIDTMEREELIEVLSELSKDDLLEIIKFVAEEVKSRNMLKRGN